MPFIAIQKLRDLVSDAFDVRSRADRDILIDLAAAKQRGEVLTMKQLVILQSESPTTTRRRISALIAAGKVVKLPKSMDGRTETYGIADDLWEKADEIHDVLRKAHIELEHRASASDKGQRQQIRA